MADRRRYTGTKTLQTGWTALAVLVLAVLTVTDALSPLLLVGGVGGAWVLGLVVLGLRERRHWQRLTAASSFDEGMEAHTSDLQQIIEGQSVTVTTDVSGILSQAHLEVRATVEGVDASFTIRIEADGAGAEGGVATGHPDIDDRFVVRGKEGNVAALLSEDVQSALLAVETPGVVTVTGEAVTYDIPFTRVTVEELDAAGATVATMAARLESIGREQSATTADSG
ncbi:MULTISPECIES: hypothetical protein [Salinibaculum]|uniref:hypothetical protein n=1 Tax=Salinibaculum TaxID=2732368 RepID=UPI0030D03024